MSTGTKLVQGALKRLGVHSPIRPANPESLEDGKDVLNSMYAGWQDKGIEIGAVPLNAIGDEFSEPLGLTATIMDNLAIMLQPLFPGSQISPELRSNANKGYENMLLQYQAVTIPNPVVRETLPKGQGNRVRYNSVYFDKGDEIG